MERQPSAAPKQRGWRHRRRWVRWIRRHRSLRAEASRSSPEGCRLRCHRRPIAAAAAPTHPHSRTPVQRHEYGVVAAGGRMFDVGEGAHQPVPEPAGCCRRRPHVARDSDGRPADVPGGRGSRSPHARPSKLLGARPGGRILPGAFAYYGLRSSIAPPTPPTLVVQRATQTASANA